MEENRKIMIQMMIAVLKDIKATLYALGKDSLATQLGVVIIAMEQEIE